MSKDNPVASLDLNKYKAFLSKEGYDLKGPIVKAMIEPLNKFIKQNAVETNNEYPDW